MNIRYLIDLVESFLTEEFAPLTKGSQYVFSNKNLVQKLADAVRLDIKNNPVSFPSDFIKKVNGYTPPPAQSKKIDRPIKVANTQAERLKQMADLYASGVKFDKIGLQFRLKPNQVENDLKKLPEFENLKTKHEEANIPRTLPSTTVAIPKATDQEIAHWFLSNLDRIEQTGYEGNPYSRDGVNSKWIVEKYIKGAHNWEDITGTLNMNLSKWYFLKNRNMLDANHTDLGKFDSIRDLGFYLVYHYEQILKDYNEKMRVLAMRRSVRAFIIVDNNDYKIYTTLNRAANVAMGLGTTWCTANSSYAGHFDNYSSRAMIFQLNPYDPSEENIKKAGVDREIVGKERYQFDAGGPYFMNIADVPPNKEMIKEKYPYLYYDLVTGLKNQKSEIEEYMKTNSEDPTLQTSDTKIKTYDVDEEIKKLQKFIDAGWMTKKKRPASDGESNEEETETPNDES
jgi:hypothetical protein